MHRKIASAKEKSEKILEDMKQDIEKLSELDNHNSKDFQELKNTINKLQLNLSEYEEEVEEEKFEVEKLTEISDVEQIPKEEIINPKQIRKDFEKTQKINKKITIKNTRRSNSFRNWLFNNYEL